MKADPGIQPEILDTEEVFHGTIFDVSVDTIREGQTVYHRDVVHHPGGAGAVAVFKDMTIALVRQYRHPALRYLLEIPAGRLELPELPEECARRELEEEVGVRAGAIVKLAEFYSTPGFCEEKLWVFLATDLIETQQKLEGDEFVEIERVTFERAFEMISDGDIEDAKTIIGIIAAAKALKRDGSQVTDDKNVFFFGASVGKRWNQGCGKIEVNFYRTRTSFKNGLNVNVALSCHLSQFTCHSLQVTFHLSQNNDPRDRTVRVSLAGGAEKTFARELSALGGCDTLDLSLHDHHGQSFANIVTG